MYEIKIMEYDSNNLISVTHSDSEKDAIEDMKETLGDRKEQRYDDDYQPIAVYIYNDYGNVVATGACDWDGDITLDLD